MPEVRPRVGVLVFPGSNDDRDAVWALRALGAEPLLVWHRERELPALDAVILPGGFSYGDYLRCGAIARFAPAMESVASFAAEGGLVLGDEALTPDSSRFWPAHEYEAGRAQASFDKQYVRDYCESLGWDKTAPGPDLPEEVVAGTRARYVDAFERLTGIPFDEYLAEPELVLR